MRSFEAVNLYFRRAADQLELADHLRKLLVNSVREVQVQIPVRMDNGDLVLSSARGQSWHFEENDLNTWQRVPGTPDPVLLVRQGG